MRSMIVAAGLMAGVASATALAAANPEPGAAVPPVYRDPGICQDIRLAAAYIAVAGPAGIATIPMTQVAPDAFAIAHDPAWPATGHIRLLWTPTPNAPANLLTAVDVAADPVLLDGIAVAEGFLGDARVATAIQDVSLDPAAWPHVVTLQVGAVPAGSACAHVSMPATLIIAPASGIAPAGVPGGRLPTIDPGIGNGVVPQRAPTAGGGLQLSR